MQVTINDAQGEVQSKWLHAADLDFYMTIRPRSAGRLSVNLSPAAEVRLPEIAATMNKIPEPSPASLTTGKLDRGVIAAGPNGTWQTAQSFELGQTIFGSDDERPYAPSKSEDGYAAMVKGFQWFRFTFRENQPRLVYFVLNVTDRDVPLDVDIFQLGKDSDGKPDVVPFSDGEFVYKVEATQNYPGLYKFRTRILATRPRVLRAGSRESSGLPIAHLSTTACRRQRIRTRRCAPGMDFLVNMGDTWLSNTPRRGAVALRTTMQHSETQLCIACHPTQFTTRGLFEGGRERLRAHPARRPRVSHRSHLQQRAAALWRAQYQLGAHHLHRPHRRPAACR